MDQFSILKNTLIIAVALQHLGFMALEMFFWNKPLGLKIFGMSKEVADSSKILACNQGLYNGFLAAGLLFCFLLQDPSHKATNQMFLLGCVVAAGVFGAWTVHPKIFWIQALPAIVALALTFFCKTSTI